MAVAVAASGGVTHKVDLDTSATIARRVRAQYRRCWRNAALAVQHLSNAALYVEGWIVVNRVHPVVIEHGWCEVEGHVVDPTYTPRVSPLEPPLQYFPGLRFDLGEAGAALRHRNLPIAWSLDHDEYRRAFEGAWRDATGRRRPVPVQQTRVVNCKREPFDVFIGRPSKWGNPFRVGHDGSREHVIARFREWLIRRPTLLREVPTLRGQALGCDCAPQPCHGDVLAELANLIGS